MQEILHDCISLQPCMHSYCAGCYSGWMDTSNTCPAVRVVCVIQHVPTNNYIILSQVYCKKQIGRVKFAAFEHSAYISVAMYVMYVIFVSSSCVLQANVVITYFPVVITYFPVVITFFPVVITSFLFVVLVS